MFPVFFPGLLTFIKSYFKLGLLSILIVSLTGFVSYHYVTVTRMEHKLLVAEDKLKVCEIEIQNYIDKNSFSKESVEKIIDYYEKEISKLKSRIKKDGELSKEDILRK